MADPRQFVGTLGKPMPRRVHELWDRISRKPKPGATWAPDPGPRAFACHPSSEFVFYVDPDAPLAHMSPVVVLLEQRPIFWAYLKTKHPDKATVLRVGWPGQSAGARLDTRSPKVSEWQVAPVISIGRLATLSAD